MKTTEQQESVDTSAAFASILDKHFSGSLKELADVLELKPTTLYRRNQPHVIRWKRRIVRLYNRMKVKTEKYEI